MSDLLLDIANHLISNGFGLELKKDVFIDSKPDSCEDFLSIFEYPGSSPEPGAEVFERRIQIMYGSKFYSAAKSKSWGIFNLLNKDDPEDVTYFQNGRFAVIEALQSPFKLEADDKNRTIIICNYTVTTGRDQF